MLVSKTLLLTLNDAFFLYGILLTPYETPSTTISKRQKIHILSHNVSILKKMEVRHAVTRTMK